MKFKTTIAVMAVCLLSTTVIVLADDLTAGVSSVAQEAIEEDAVLNYPTAGFGSVVNAALANAPIVRTSNQQEQHEILKKAVTSDVSIERTDVVIVTASLEDIAVEENKENIEEDKDNKDEIKVVDTDIKEVDKTVYTKKKANLRMMPTTESEVIVKVEKGEKLAVTGETAEWYRVNYRAGDAFMSKDMCQKDNPNVLNVDEVKSTDRIYEGSDWNGKKLTKRAGTVKGPSGKETYYNLNMSNIVRRLHQKGYDGEYWVREDGVKMFGKYILVAASFDIRPLGTILPTSLGMGIVADTGGFARHNKYQLDIATTW